MYHGILSPAVGGHARRAHGGAHAPRPEEPARIDELRGVAMRRMFPKRYGGRAHELASRIAEQVYATLAAATTRADLERRSRYPLEWVHEVPLRDGRSILVRPVLPTDAPMHRAFVRSMSATTRLNRFHGGVADLPDSVLRYLTDVDYIDHMALVGEVIEQGGARQVAEARWVRRTEERDRADFAIAIADDHQSSGLGHRLLDLLERSAATKGIRRLCGHVLRANGRMLGLLEARGWTTERDPDDPRVLCVELPLRAAATPAWRAAA